MKPVLTAQQTATRELKPRIKEQWPLLTFGLVVWLAPWLQQFVGVPAWLSYGGVGLTYVGWFVHYAVRVWRETARDKRELETRTSRRGRPAFRSPSRPKDVLKEPIMSKRRFALWSIPLVLLLLLGCGSLFGAYSKIATSIDNTPVRGKVLEVGHSNVSSAPYTVTYAFDVPGFPRNGNAGSFTREQIVTKKDLARFKPGMEVDVERSKWILGASRIRGFGQGSILWHELRGGN